MVSLAIIDIDSIAFSIGWGNKIPDPDKEGDFLRDDKGRLLYVDKTREQLFESADYFMSSILEECGADYYIAYIKGSNTSKHRYAIKHDYKHNRPKESPSWWKDVVEYLTIAWNVNLVNDIEVDDAVNITRLCIPESFIVAIDKDLLHLEGTHYNWKTKEWITTSKEEAYKEFWSDMITGQSVDGITGVPRKGKSYVSKMDLNPNTVLEEYIKYYGEKDGVSEFVKNYTCLKILEEYPRFVVPKPIKVGGGYESDDIWLK